MRLLSVDKDGKLCLTEFHQNIPPYAVLSHTWRPDGGEVLFKNVNDGSAREKAGYNKVAFCGETAASHGLKYFWVDTCCIDKSSSSELQESINSMFSYYRGANRCYVYLADVSVRDYDLSSHSSQRSLETSFRNSRWFTRGWTLQELIAPSSVEFYSQEGKRLGDKHSLGRQIHEATGIPVSAFQGAPLSGFDIEARLKWSKGRQTTREEDWAYSLFGIFDVCLPLLYGEGRTKAITRLMREIHLGSRGFSQNLPISSDITGTSLQSDIGQQGSSNIQGTAAQQDVPSADQMLASGSLVRNSSTITSGDSASGLHRAASPLEARAAISPKASGKVQTKEVLNEFGSFSEWASSFAPGDSNKEHKEDEGEKLKAFLAAKKHPKSRAVDKSPMLVRDQELGTSRIGETLPMDLGEDAILAASSVASRIRRNLSGERHVIITGLKKLGDTSTFVEEISFTDPKSIIGLVEDLKTKGYINLVGFRHLRTQRLIMPVTSDKVMPLNVTDGPSCYDIRLGLRINENETLVDYYNRLVRDECPASPSQGSHCLKVVGESNLLMINTACLGRRGSLRLEFMRTLRIPDDGQSYSLPAHFGSLPLYDVTRSSKPLPPRIEAKGGMILPMYQREALSLCFRASKYSYDSETDGKEELFAVRVNAGSINCLTGKPETPENGKQDSEQDYLVVSQKSRLDGFRDGTGTVRQFIAMPLGLGYSVENQVTGREYFGGLQFQIATRLLTCVDFHSKVEMPSGHASLNPVGEKLDIWKTPKELQLSRPVIWMTEQPGSPRDEYNRSQRLREAWKDVKNCHNTFPSLAQSPVSYGWRMTFVDEAYGSLYSDQQSRSESLVLQTVEDLKILIDWRTFGIEREPSIERYSPFMHISAFKREIVRVMDKILGGRMQYGVILINGVVHRGHPDQYLPLVELTGNISDAVLSFQREKQPPGRGLGRLGCSQGSSTPVQPDGWEMVLGAGAKLSQPIQKTTNPDLWNWKDSCFINVQIMNSIAFEDLTGVSPVCSLSFREYRLAGLPFFNAALPDDQEELDSSTIHIESISNIDSTKNIQLGVRMRKDTSPVICIVCERAFCDTLLSCHHIFCSECIKLEMQGTTGNTQCAFCEEDSNEIKQFSAYMELPKDSTDGAESRVEVAKILDILPLLPESEKALEPHERVVIELESLMTKQNSQQSLAKFNMIMQHLAKVANSEKVTFVKALLGSKAALCSAEVVRKAVALVPDLSKFNAKDLDLILTMVTDRPSSYKYSYDAILQWMFSGPHPVSKPKVDFKTLMRAATLPSSVEKILNYLRQQGTSVPQEGITVHDGNRNTESIALLVEAGCDINELDGTGSTVFSRTGDEPKLVEALLKAGARADTQNFKGQTEVHIAIEKFHESKLAMLLRHESGKACLTIKDNDGMTPWDYAVSQPKYIQKRLLDAGAKAT